MADVIEINNLDSLADLRSRWETLLAVTPNADFFHTLEWLETYWRHYGSGQRFRILLVLEAGDLQGIVPLVVRRERTRLGPFSVLTYPLDDWGSFYGPIGADPEWLLAVGLEYLLDAARDWDFLEIRWSDTGPASDNWVNRALRQAGIGRPRRRLHTQIPIVRMDVGWDTYWASRSSSWRSNCRRNEKKLAAAGPIEHIRYRPSSVACGGGDPRWDLYEECERVAAMSWQGSSTSGTTITHAGVRKFLRDVHRAAAAAGCLDLNLLKVGSRSAAFVYNYIGRGYVSSLRMGFDPDFRRHGVGTVLTGRMLRDSFVRGDRVFDFLPGSLDAKKNWQTSLETSYRYCHVPPRLGRVQLISLKRWLDDRLLMRRDRGCIVPTS